LVSELNKIAIVHLYAQGYKDAALVNFNLELTNPSVIFEKEKIGMWSDKVGVAKDILELKLFSKRWVYDEIFHMASDDIAKVSNEVIDDTKQLYRFKQIEEEGNDPAKPMERIKAPDQDSAGGGPGGPLGGDDGPGGGAKEPTAKLEEEKNAEPYVRPSQAGKKKATDYPFGEDKLGALTRSVSNDETDPLRHEYKGGSPFKLESRKSQQSRPEPVIETRPGHGHLLENFDLVAFDKYLSSHDEDRQELINEQVNSLSYMDESRLLD
jgi:hypothetical protein